MLSFEVSARLFETWRHIAYTSGKYISQGPEYGPLKSDLDSSPACIERVKGTGQPVKSLRDFSRALPAAAHSLASHALRHGGSMWRKSGLILCSFGSIQET